jgi:hypothetical protein
MLLEWVSLSQIFSFFDTMLPATLSLLATAILASPAMAERPTTMLHLTFFSHLSPLLQYTPSTTTNDPEQGWNVSLARHATNSSESRLEWSGFASTFELSGNSSNVVLGLESAGDDVPDYTSVSNGPYVARFRRDAFTDPRSDVYNVTVRTNGSATSYMELDRGLIRAVVPADPAALDGNGLPVAIHQAATDADFFQDVDDAWEIIEPPSNQSVGIQWQLAGPQSSTSGADFPWNSTVLSTTQVGAPLRFTVPPYTSYLQWDGTVGPDQGRYEFRLIPTGDNEPRFAALSNNQTYTGECSVDAIHEVKVVAYLDPRSTYDAEIVLLEDGKRTDLHGISFWRYTEM